MNMICRQRIPDWDDEMKQGVHDSEHWSWKAGLISSKGDREDFYSGLK